MSQIKLIAGVSVKNVDNIRCEYKKIRGGLELTLSAEDYMRFFRRAVSNIPEPLYFFIEIPQEDGDDYDTYYLDNCTAAVAQAIVKRYGGVLFSDGVIRFGFGSHGCDEEIYMREFQLLRICSENIHSYEKIVVDLGYVENENALSIWDILSEDNPGSRESVECDDESFLDIIANLGEIGLYKQVK